MAAPTRRSTLLWMGAIPALLFIAHLLGSTQNYTYADDSLPFAWLVHTGTQISVHHLVLAALRVLNQGLGFTGPEDYGKTIQMVKLYIALASALGLGLAGVLSLRWFGSVRGAVATMLAVAFTYGYWSYSIAPDVYVAAISFTLLAVYFADRSYDDPGSPRATLFLALSAVSILVAALNHQAHSIVVVAIAGVLAFARRRELPRALRFRRAATLFLLTGLLGFVVFYSAYRAAHIDMPFDQWVRGYTAWMPKSPWDGLQLRTPIYAALGITRALVFSEYALHFDAGYERMHRAFPIKILFDDRYVTYDLPDAAVALLLVLAGVVLIGLAVLLVRSLLLLRRQPPTAPGAAMLVHWIWVQTLFFAAWEPTSNEFWIWLLPCLAIFAFGPLFRGAARGAWTRLAWLVPAGLLVVNAPVLVRYASREHDIYRINKTYLVRLAPNDLPLTRAAYGIMFLERLEAPAVHPLGCFEGRFDMADTALTRRLEGTRAAGGRVVLDPMLTSPDDSENRLQEFLAHTTRDSAEHELRRLETWCAANHVPLLAVERRGAESIPFVPCRFEGYAQWVDDRLRPQTGTSGTPGAPRAPGIR